MWMHRLMAAVAALCVLFAASISSGQCSPRLVGGYDFGRLRVTGSSVSDSIYCGAVFDDHSGTGPCLFAGGSLTVLGEGGGSWLAKLVNGRWEAVPGFNGAVRCLSVIDDGSGPALYVGGSFTANPSGGSGALVRWDGLTWTDLGVSCSGVGGVYCVSRFDDGSGPALFAGGSSIGATGGTLNGYVLKNAGSGWLNVNGGPWLAGNIYDSTAVRGFVPFDDGGGARLYAYGSFNQAGSVVAHGAAVWTGGGWAAAASGLTDANFRSMVVHPVAGVPTLFAGGELGPGLSLTAVWRKDGATWTPVLNRAGTFASGIAATALISFDDGGGPVLHAIVGRDTHLGSEVWRMDGGEWSPVGAAYSNSGGPGIGPYLDAFVSVASAQAQRLVVLGKCTSSGLEPTPNAAELDNGTWRSVEPVGSGLPSAGLVCFDPESDDGTVYTMDRTYTAAGWAPSVYPFAGMTNMLRLHQGAISELIVQSGYFLLANDGSGWISLPWTGGFADVFGISTDTGEETLVGVRNLTAYRLVGGTFQSLGSPVSGSTLHTSISCVGSYDDGSGAKLYVGGVLQAASNGWPTSYLAYLQDGQWVQVPGLPGYPKAMRVFDVGDGPELIIACTWSGVVGPATGGVYRWNGQRIAPVGNELGNCHASALLAFDDGSGERLWTTCYGSPIGSLAYWDGAQWRGVPGVVGNGAINSLAPALRADRSHSLMLGGAFAAFGDVLASGIAELATCPRACTSDFDGDGDVGTDADIEAFFACLAGSCCAECGSADFNNDGQAGTDADIASFFSVLAGGGC